MYFVDFKASLCKIQIPVKAQIELFREASKLGFLQINFFLTVFRSESTSVA